MESLPAAAAITTLIGTVIEFLRAAFDLRANEREVVETWSAVDGLLTEVPAWRVLRRRRRRREVRGLLAAHPEDRRAYNRIKWTLAGWLILTVGAGFAAVAAVVPE